jgi:hypothetical protein
MQVSCHSDHMFCPMAYKACFKSSHRGIAVIVFMSNLVALWGQRGHTNLLSSSIRSGSGIYLGANRVSPSGTSISD